MTQKSKIKTKGTVKADSQRNKKPRAKRAEKTDYENKLKSVRSKLPIHTCEIEIVSKESNFATKKTKKGVPITKDKGKENIIKISENMRLMRNTVLGLVYNNYKNMVRTKAYKLTINSYKKVALSIAKLENKKTKSPEEKQELSELRALKKTLGTTLENLKVMHNVTKAWVVNYCYNLKDTTFKNVNSILALKCADRIWLSMEKIMFGEAEKPRFLKKGEYPSLEGKQAERCIILKFDDNNQNPYLNFGDYSFDLVIPQNDLFLQDTIFNLVNYKRYGKDIDKTNVELFDKGKTMLNTGRLLYNRIVLKEIRGTMRLYLQMIIEGNPAVKKKKNGEQRHKLGKGRVTSDVGTQSLAAVSKEEVLLKNLAERGKNAFAHEHKITLIQNSLNRSMRQTNPDFFNKNGTYKNKKHIPKDAKWVVSKSYLRKKKKLRELHRKAALSRQYAINEDVNYLRRLGDEMIIEKINIKALQKKAKKVEISEKTYRFKRRKRFGKSIARRSPGYYIQQLKYRFSSSGGKFIEVDTWNFKASQYDHMLDDCSKKSLSKRWHELPNGIKVQRDIYSAFLLYCSNESYTKPDVDICNKFFDEFLKMHNLCIEYIKDNKIKVMNSGIKIA